MKFKVYECELKVTATGKELKKLVLQGEGKQYPDKGVTMWSDHPLFETVAAGHEIDVELEIKDSNTPNPKGGFYKNKTVLKPGQTPQAPVSPQQAENTSLALQVSRLENMINFKLQGAIDRLEKLGGFMAGEKPKDDFQMPDFGESKDVTESSPF